MRPFVSFLRFAAFLISVASFCSFAQSATLPAGFVEQNVGAGWYEPVGLTFDPAPERANRVYVWERTGTVWIVENGVKLPNPLISISWEVGSWNDYGMLGVALHPNFAQNGYIYLFYVVDRYDILNAGNPNYDYTANLYRDATIGRITRYTARASDGFRTVDPASRVVLLGESKTTGIPILHGSHGVGHLAFGTDGTLLASCGDAASWEALDDGGPDGNSYAVQGLADGIIKPKEDVGAFRSQLVDSLNGKVLRLDPNTGNGVPSNPFYDPANPRAPKSRLWALGLRNPYRMTVRPGTGSHDPADANPGVIVLSDVGYETWESVHVITGPGQNCGWPLYEGLTPTPNYQAVDTLNLDAPNPLGGYFRFKDLLVQETLGTPSWPNPLNPSQQVPATIPKFMRIRPVIDIGRGTNGPARTGTFNGNTATEILIGAPGSPVAGPQFEANAGTAGTFYTGSDFPAAYQGSYFFADYGRNWIKNIVFGANHRPTEIRSFADVETPVFVATHPSTGGLYYVNLVGNEVRRIDYAPGGNRLPVANASANVTYGPSPLAVTFSSTGSSDPEGTALSYLWTFGDGTTSTQANPSKSFTASGTQRFDVKLRVTDGAGAFAEKTLPIFVNHTPPTVEVLSPANGTKYALNVDTTYGLVRRVGTGQGRTTTTRWQVVLHHDTHQHPEPAVDAEESSAVIHGINSTTGTYYYRVICTVTDDLGASAQAESFIVPNKTNVAPVVTWSAPLAGRDEGAGALLVDSHVSVVDADSAGLEFGRLQFNSSVTSDVFSILPQGDGAGQINVEGASVRHGGVAVGTLSGGASGEPFVVTFRSTVTPVIAQTIARRVAVQCTSGGNRVITAAVVDGDGGTSVATPLQLRVGNRLPAVTLSGPANGAVFNAPASIALTATATDPDGTVAKVEFYSGDVKLGEDQTAPYGYTWNGVTAGTYYLTAVATDEFNGLSVSTTATVTVNPTTEFPTEWQTRDIGTAEVPGNVTYSDGAFTATSTGSGYSTVDSFQFVSQALTGDGEIIARVAGVNAPSSSALAGVMIRESRAPNARHALIALKSGAEAGSTFQWRAQPSALVRGKPLPTGSAPQWMRLVRHGARCTGYYSTDGVRWEQAWTVALLLPPKVFLGLATSSGANDGSTASAVFDNVTVRTVPADAGPLVEFTNPANGATFAAPDPVTLDVTASDPNGGVARVDLFLNAKKLATDLKAPFSFVWPKPVVGGHEFTARAVDFTGRKTTSAPLALTVEGAPNSLPVPWGRREIGGPSTPGTSEFANGSLTVTTSGSDLLLTTDQAHFVWQSWTGDGTLIARVASIAPSQPSALGGVIFRESFAANSRFAAAVLTQGEGASLRYRAEPATDSATGIAKSVTAPQWLRIVRRGTRFATAVSADGVTWQGLGSTIVAMSPTCKVGLIVCAGPGGENTTVIFDTISLSAPAGE